MLWLCVSRYGENKMVAVKKSVEVVLNSAGTMKEQMVMIPGLQTNMRPGITGAVAKVMTS